MLFSGGLASKRYSLVPPAEWSDCSAAVGNHVERVVRSFKVPPHGRISPRVCMPGVTYRATLRQRFDRGGLAFGTVIVSSAFRDRAGGDAVPYSG